MLKSKYIKLFSIVWLNIALISSILASADLVIENPPALKKHLYYSAGEVFNSAANDNFYTVRIPENIFTSAKMGTVRIYYVPGFVGELDKVNPDTEKLASLTINDTAVIFTPEPGANKFLISLSAKAKTSSPRKSFHFNGPECQIIFSCNFDRIPQIQITANKIYLPDHIKFLRLVLRYSSAQLQTFPYAHSQSIEDGLIKLSSPPEVAVGTPARPKVAPTSSITWPAPTCVPLLFNDEFDFSVEQLLDITTAVLAKEARYATTNMAEWKANELNAINELENNDDKIKYLKDKILSNLLPDSKGEVAEAFTKHWFITNDFNCHDTKSGATNQGLDGVYSSGDELHIVEVKFSAKDKRPAYLKENIDGLEWRQLSRPYVEKKLATFVALAKANSDPDKIATYDMIMKMKNETPELVKLWFVQFNLEKFTLDFYAMGDMTKSLMD